MRDLIQRFGIGAPSANTPVRLLSGGNLQRVILAREITAGAGHGNGSGKRAPARGRPPAAGWMSAQPSRYASC